MTDLCNTTYDELAADARQVVSRTLTAAHVEALAQAAGDVEPSQLVGHLNDTALHASGAAAVSIVAALLLRQLPGPGTRILETRCRYAGTLTPGDTLTATISVVEKRANRVVLFACRCVNQRDEVLVDGEIIVEAPEKKARYDVLAGPDLVVRGRDGFVGLERAAAPLPAVSCAVVHPCDRDSLLGPLEAARRGLIVPILIGPEAKIRSTAAAHGADLQGIRIIDVPHSHAAADKAVELARAGEVASIMKGSLHTDELMEAVVASATGLRTDRRMSHTFVLDVPTYPRLLYVTDAAINIAPDLSVKVDIVRNVLDLAHALGLEQPRVAILSAVETVNPKLESTMHAAALCKMAERNQIQGGILDGPLAFDNAVSEEAAKTKGIASEVAGRADVLVVPDIESGNMLAKQLQYLAGAGSAGIVMGARVPIVLTSRADSVRSRLASIVVCKLVAHAHGKR